MCGLIAVVGICLCRQAAATSTRSDAEYQTRVAELKKILPATFTIVIQPPFVVAGDETPEEVQTAADHIVKWTVEHLKKDYFPSDPTDLITIYLFKDKVSYQKYTDQLFHHRPSTPFGYYSPTDHALIMDLSTGGGTLVHEIVHPFVAANFPDCPPWFNEGLGSLYEQSAEKDGHIVGLTNWRLTGLQKFIQENGRGTLPSFKTLCAMDTETFYNKDKGTNYAQSRYLCYYLQQNNLLQKYYKAFLRNRDKDPTGYATLSAILQQPDMEAFQRVWGEWVLGLKFP